MAIIPKFFFDAVVAIGVKLEDDISWIGTGFLVGRKEQSPNNYTIYLVTNYHIVQNKNKIVVRFNQVDANDCKDYTVTLKNDTEELFSKHAVADVIAIQISPGFLKDNNSEYSWFALDRHALDLKQMKDTDVIEDAYKYSINEKAFTAVEAYEKMI